MRIVAPASAEEAARLMAEPGTRAVAGGTALQAAWAQGEAPPERLVRLDRLGLAGIEVVARGLRIGATTTLDEIERSEAVAGAAPLLSRAVRDVGAPGIRRLGTLGGQLGWGAGCLLPALLALGARLDVTGAGEVGLAEWLAAPSGLVLRVVVPAQAPGARWCWRKVGLREAFTPAVVVVAGVAGHGGAALAVGGGVVPPARLPGAEAALVRGPDALRAAVLAEMEAPDCALRTGRYRRRVAAAALVEGLFGAPATEARPARGPSGAMPAGLRPLTRDPSAPEWHGRADGPDKIAGRAGHLTDARAPGMLVGRILRAGRAHARIVSIDASAAEAMAGVRAVVTAADVPGLNAFGIVRQDQPAICADVVRYEGDPVAAVAAVDAAVAEAALGAIRVAYEDLPPVTDPAAALEPGAPALHEGGNLAASFAFERGDPAPRLAEAAHVVEETYVTPRQMHAFLETEGGWCAPDSDGLTVAVGGQHGARDRLQLSRILGLPEERIRVITSPVGGGFGGKDELTVQPALALLALKARAPVRLHLSRAESVVAGVKSPPMRIRMRTGCDAQGRLVGQEVDLLADGGAYASLSPAVVETALEHALGPYLCHDVTTRGRLAHTDNGTCGAFRGFGANQMTFAVECQVDRLAAMAGLDPVEMRRRNLRRPGMPGLMGHAVAGSERLQEMLAAAAASPLWRPPEVRGPERRGTGMALNLQGNGLGSLPPDEGEAELRLAPDGAIEVLCGLDEMGQGLVPALQASVAHHLGCARGDVRPVFGDTGLAPDAGSTSASRGSFVAWTSARLAAPGFAAQLLALAAARLGTSPEALRVVPGGVAEAARNDAAPRLGFAELAGAADPPRERVAFAFPKTAHTRGNARFVHCCGATLARVAVDGVSGRVRVEALEMHTAAGPVIDLAAYLGQIEGGLVQGLGFTLSEDVALRGGLAVTRNLDGYMIPTVRDVPPELRVTALESLDAGDPWGPRGVGELGVGAVAPAVANAVGAALGRWPTAAPFSPEAVLDLLEGAV